MLWLAHFAMSVPMFPIFPSWFAHLFVAPACLQQVTHDAFFAFLVRWHTYYKLVKTLETFKLEHLLSYLGDLFNVIYMFFFWQTKDKLQSIGIREVSRRIFLHGTPGSQPGK